ncbi:MAG: sugar ABC transporter permease [Methylobacteriaceae bacterium]|nr:sugar ABC transporter permease [Methylobacteriaceae bacterium]MBV9246488.1 sugar ABC transporter permease [Methylobacteriaceae bacterium]
MQPRFRNWHVQLALLPAWLIVVFAYLGTMVFTVRMSFTSSKGIPIMDDVGLRQYDRLFHTDRWTISVENILIFGLLFILGCLILGFLLAVFVDRLARFENTLRTIFLYPLAMSFVVTGLVWQWILNPALGLQANVRNWGWTSFTFDWLEQGDRAIYLVAFAGIWQSCGLVMAIMLAGLRGVDQELWKAARIDGIPTWRIYLHIIIPALAPMFITATLLLATAVVRSYDIVVAMTAGGPGISSEVPAKFVIDFLFTRQNIGLATAAATVMLITVLVVLMPWLYLQYFRSAPGARRAA